MNRMTGLVVVGLLAGLSACTAGASSAPPPNEPPHSPSVPLDSSTPPAAEDRAVAVYTTLLRRQFALEPRLYRRVAIEAQPRGSARPLSRTVERAITRRFAPKVRVRWYWQQVVAPISDEVQVTLPPLPSGSQFRVTVSDVCGNLCGHWQRYVVRYDGTWTARPVGATRIS